MSQTSKPKMNVQVYEQFPRRRSDAATHQFTLEQVKKYLSAKPLRHAPPRTPKPPASPDGQQQNSAERQPPGQS